MTHDYTTTHSDKLKADNLINYFCGALFQRVKVIAALALLKNPLPWQVF
jgi:hypothetical protein